MITRHKIIISILIILFLISVNVNADSKYFQIKIIDQETGRGVPMVELKTLNHIRYFTDSNGLIAFYEPGLMNEIVYFGIHSTGYEYQKSKDIFRTRGIALHIIPDDSAQIFIKRINIAERLYRVTGAGIYKDSHMLGIRAPIRNHLLNGDVLGQDSVLGLIYKGRIFWIWGDTIKPSHPFGNFSISAATSRLSGDGGLDPGVGIDLQYYTDSTGFANKMIDIPEPGYVWFDWIMQIQDDRGNEILVAKYARVKVTFENHERGLAIFNDKTESFEKYKQIDEWLSEYHSCVHPFLAKVKNDNYYYLTAEFRFSRIRPNLKDIENPKAYESFTCLVEGEKYDINNLKLDRSSNGELIWGWKQNTDPIDIFMQQALIDSSKIKQDEAWIQLRNIETGERINTKRNSIYWNEYRQRWILIAAKMVGEIWYSEADTPVGPWVYTRKVAQHDVLLYNPTQHPFFDQDNGRIIYFEGTYTKSFSGNPIVIPRYEYNQLMYRLTLNDPRLFLPVPVYLVQIEDYKFDYQLREEISSQNNWDKIVKIAFFALPPDRKIPGSIPIYKTTDNAGISLTTQKAEKLLFYALPSDNGKFDEITGAWRCSLIEPGIWESNFKLMINKHGSIYKGTTDDSNFQINDISLKNNKIVITLKAYSYTIYLTGTLKNGKMNGTWKTANNSKNGTWSAKLVDDIKLVKYSKSIVPLHSYLDSKNFNYYMTSREENDQSGKPICNVWENPYSLLILDYEAQPIRNFKKD